MNDLEVEIDFESELEVEIDFPQITVNTGTGGNIEIKNSDASFDVTATTSPYILEDTTINVFVNGILNTTIVRPSMVDRTINITA